MRVFFPFLLLLTVIALVTRVDLFFTVVWFLAGIYALSRFWFRRALTHVRVGRHFSDHAFFGDELLVTLVLRNQGRLPVPWLELSESLPVEIRGRALPDQAVSLRPGEERAFTYTLSCGRRGYFRLGPLRVAAGDLLGLEERVLLWEEERPLVVYPRVVPLHHLGLPTRSVLALNPARTPFFEDTSRTIGVRDYRPGDSPRRIHWKATARTGELLVKQYQQAIARDTLICLDLDPAHYDMRRLDAIELAVTVAASLANHIIAREGLPAGLAMDGRDQVSGQRRRFSLPPRPGHAQLMGILEMLARVDAERQSSFTDLLHEERLKVSWGATLVVVTGTVDDAIAGTVLGLKRSGHAVTLILIQPGRRGPDVYGSGGLPVYHVWSDLELVPAS